MSSYGRIRDNSILPIASSRAYLVSSDLGARGSGVDALFEADHQARVRRYLDYGHVVIIPCLQPAQEGVLSKDGQRYEQHCDLPVGSVDVVVAARAPDDYKTPL